MNKNSQFANAFVILFFPIICFIGIFVCIYEDWKDKCQN